MYRRERCKIGSKVDGNLPGPHKRCCVLPLYIQTHCETCKRCDAEIRSRVGLKASTPYIGVSFGYPKETKLPFHALGCRAALQAVASLLQTKPRVIPAYFFSGVPPGGVATVVAVGVPAAAVAPAVPGVGNGNVLNIDFAWVCICSCICTNMFFDCSI